MSKLSSSDARIDLSIVVPAMNEEDALPRLHERIVSVCREQGLRFEVILIDDGSTDQTWAKMVALTQGDPNTLAIQFRRNFGKAAALAAGFGQARGRVVITMDADLQDDPNEIPRFFVALDSQLDVISGWKRVRHDPWHKTLPSRVFNWLVSGLTGVHLHDHNCGFKAYRREVLSQIDLYGERHRFIPVLASALGWRVGEIEVLHHPRRHGQSKYGVSRLLKGLLDLMSIYLLTGYARRPLHLIGSAGLACFAAGSVGIVYLSLMWVWTRLPVGIEGVAAEPLHLHATAIFYYCILAVLLGAQCVLAGLLAELIVSQGAARGRADRDLARRMERSGTALGDESAASGVLPLRSSDYNIRAVAGTSPSGATFLQTDANGTSIGAFERA